MSLTKLQENFTMNLVDGMSQRQAYINAGYSVDNMKTSTIDSLAYRLAKNPKVRKRYRQILKEQSNLFLWGQEQAFNEYEWLKNKAKEQIKEEGVRQSTATAFVNALEGMNDMAFKELELSDRKLLAEIRKTEAEIERIKQQTDPEMSTEDLLSDYLGKLNKVISDGVE